MRSIRMLGLTIIVLSAAMLGGTDLRAQISQTSVEGQNITAAVDFLKSIGASDVATQISTALKNGKYFQADVEKLKTGEKGDLAQTDPATKNITLDNSLVGKVDNNTVAFDPKKDFGKIFNLAKTIFHESIHAGQKLGVDRSAKEYEAWSKTLPAVNDWMRRLIVEYRKAVRSGDKDARLVAAQKLEAMATIFASEAGEMIETHDAFGHDKEPWKKFATLANDAKGIATELKFSELLGRSDTKEKQKQLESIILGQIIAAERKALGLPDPPPPKPFRLLPQVVPGTGVGRIIGLAPRREEGDRMKQYRAISAQLVAAALPGGFCPGAVPGSETRKRDPDPNVVLQMVRECHSGNGSQARD